MVRKYRRKTTKFNPEFDKLLDKNIEKLREKSNGSH
jgi:hypothetical protein